jgi:hypothetical protein
MDHKSLK